MSPLQGYQLFVGDLRGCGRVEWPLRVLLMLGGIALAAPGGGIMPVTHEQMAWLAFLLLVPTLGTAYWMVRRRAAPIR